jgi:hypothetical protein
MRFCALLLALAGCHAASSAPPPSGLVVHVSLATAPTSSDVAVASVALSMPALTAVSDRSASDARATSSNVMLGLGDTTDLMLPSAPPGLYSAVDTQLGNAAGIGLELQAVWNAARVHATVTSTPFDVGCPTPVRLDPGHQATLTLHVDPASWFAGIDLHDATGDADDNGIVISADDNLDVAQTLVANAVASCTLDCAQ